MLPRRFRLRFVFQELDITGPEVILGRSSDCHISIEDPLVSRRHARLLLASDPPCIEDLESRNGVKVNDVRIDGVCPLQSGDRIRLGKNELVFVVEQASGRVRRVTGSLIQCHSCGTPFPEQPLCPHCGAAARKTRDSQDDTLASTGGSAKNWALRLLAEAIARALDTDRLEQAGKILAEAASGLEVRLGAGKRLSPEDTSRFACLAIRLAVAARQQDWLVWGLRLHERQDCFPSARVLDHLETIDKRTFVAARAPIAAFAEWCRLRSDGGGDLNSRLDALAQSA